MKELVFLLLSGTGFCFFLIGLVLLLKPSVCLFRSRILGVIFIIFSWYILIALLVVSGTLIRFPYLFRTGVPLYYMVPPLIFIYVRSIYMDEYNFRKYDWLHFVPSLLAFIDVFPYLFLTDNAVKHADLIKCTAVPVSMGVVGSGFLPAITHYVMRALHGIVYLFFTWKVIFKMDSSLVAEGPEVKILTGLFTLVYVGNIINFGSILSQNSWMSLYRLNSIYNISVLLILIVLMLICLFFLTGPSILYQITGRLTTPVQVERTELLTPLPEVLQEEKPKAEVKQDLCPVFLAEFLPGLEKLMTSTQLFKQQGITVNEVALKLNVTPHVLSAVLNNHYGQRFTDFINQYRITYVIELIQSDMDHRQFTIEGLSMMAGFSSRAPFYTAFKKHTGTTPSEYLRRLQHQAG